MTTYFLILLALILGTGGAFSIVAGWTASLTRASDMECMVLKFREEMTKAGVTLNEAWRDYERVKPAWACAATMIAGLALLAGALQIALHLCKS